MILQTVPHVDLERYLGTWYEIAAIPVIAELGSVAGTATYTLNPDRSLKVINRCRMEHLDGPFHRIEGRGWVDDPQTNSKLKVSFFWWAVADYWILDLGPEYDYAVVGGPKRHHAWFLHRQPQMDEELYQTLLARLRDQHGYDIGRMVRVVQPRVDEQHRIREIFRHRVELEREHLSPELRGGVAAQALLSLPGSGIDARRAAALMLAEERTPETEALLQRLLFDPKEDGFVRLHAALSLAFQARNIGRDLLRRVAEAKFPTATSSSGYEISLAGLGLLLLGEKVDPAWFQTPNSIYSGGSEIP